MNVQRVDYVALVIIGLKWVAVILGIYILILVAVRFSGILTLTVCPNCGRKLKRSQRKPVDKTVHLISFGILPVKRYRCYTCYWNRTGLGLKLPVQSTPEQKSA